MKRILLCILLLWAVAIANAQFTTHLFTYSSPIVQHEYFSRDFIHPDDSTYVLLSLDDSSGHWGAAVTNTDASGNLRWNVYIRDTTYLDRFDPVAILQTSDKGYFIFANHYHYLGPTQGSLNGIGIIRIDSLGNFMWAKRRYGGSSYETLRGAVKTSDGNYMILGSTNHTSVNDYKDLHIKMDETGAIIYAKSFNYFMFARDMEEADGNYHFSCGRTIYKTDPAGNFIRSGLYTLTLSGDFPNFMDIDKTPDGGMVIGSWDYTPINSGGIIKIDSLGIPVWNTVIDNTSPGSSAIRVVKAMSDGSVLGTIDPQSGAGQWENHTVKLDSGGDRVWCHKSYNVRWPVKFFELPDNQTVLYGQGFNSTGFAGALLRTDSTGLLAGCIAPDLTFVDSSISLSVTFDSTIVGFDVAQVDTPFFCHVIQGGNMDTVCFTSGIRETTGQSMSIGIYPNPAVNYLTVRLPGSVKPYSLTIYSITGEKVFYSSGFTGKESTIDIRHLAGGMYYVIVAGENILHGGRVIIE